MAGSPTDVLTEARRLMGEGKVTEADQLIAQHQADQAAAAAIAAGQPPPAPAPRLPQVVFMDILNTITELLGNHPKLKSLIAEIEAVGRFF